MAKDHGPFFPASFQTLRPSTEGRYLWGKERSRWGGGDGFSRRSRWHFSKNQAYAGDLSSLIVNKLVECCRVDGQVVGFRLLESRDSSGLRALPCSLTSGGASVVWLFAKPASPARAPLPASACQLSTSHLPAKCALSQERVCGLIRGLRAVQHRVCPRSEDFSPPGSLLMAGLPPLDRQALALSSLSSAEIPQGGEGLVYLPPLWPVSSYALAGSPEADHTLFLKHLRAAQRDSCIWKTHVFLKPGVKRNRPS